MKRKRNNPARPSLIGDTVDTFVPTGFMERMAQGASADFKRLTGIGMSRERRRRNPDELAADSLASRLAPGAVVPGGIVALTALEVADALDQGLIDETAGVLLAPPKAETTANPHRKRARRNPEESSALAYEIFHGKPPAGYTEVIEEIHEHEHLWVLGTLEKLIIDTVSGYQATWEFIGNDKPLLCGSEPEPGSTGLFGSNMVCTQLYVRGGDQTLALDKVKMGEKTKWWKEEMVIGQLVEVTYFTQKGFDNFKPVDYFHQLGEETGDVPTIVYDTRNRLLSIAGGQYEIKAEGITN